LGRLTEVKGLSPKLHAQPCPPATPTALAQIRILSPLCVAAVAHPAAAVAHPLDVITVHRHLLLAASSGAPGPPPPQVPPTHDDCRPPAPWTQRPPPARGPLLRPSHVDGHSVTLGLSHCNHALTCATPPAPAVGWHHRASPVLLRPECRPPMTATDLPHWGHDAHCRPRSSPPPWPSRRLPGRPRALTQQLCPRSSTFSHRPGPAAHGQVIVRCQLARLLPVCLVIGLQ
jgi:hypothetical protein